MYFLVAKQIIHNLERRIYFSVKLSFKFGKIYE